MMPLVELPPLRRDSLGGTLGDVDCHLPENHPYSSFGEAPNEQWRYPAPYSFTEYGSDDKVTDAHECTHGVNSRVRNETRNEVGLYFLNNKAFVVPNHPNFTLSDLAAAIPPEKRGRLYKLYLQDQQRWWNNEPLYVLDELTAYCYGARAGFELGMTDRGNESRDNAREMWRYSRIAAAMARRDDYEHQAALDEFLDSFHKEHLSPLLTA
jgi:hypothetical protein